MNISPSVLATLALLASSGVWAHKIRGTNSRHLMAPGAAIIENKGDEGSNNQNNVIIGENNWNYAIVEIIQEEQGGSPETSPAPSVTPGPTCRDDWVGLEDYEMCAREAIGGPVLCRANDDAGGFYRCSFSAEDLDLCSGCVPTTGDSGILYCCAVGV